MILWFAYQFRPSLPHRQGATGSKTQICSRALIDIFSFCDSKIFSKSYPWFFALSLGIARVVRAQNRGAHSHSFTSRQTADFFQLAQWSDNDKKRTVRPVSPRCRNSKAWREWHQAKPLKKCAHLSRSAIDVPERSECSKPSLLSIWCVCTSYCTCIVILLWSTCLSCQITVSYMDLPVNSLPW